MNKYNIILADDHALFRSGIHGILKKLPNINKIVEAANGLEVMSQIKLNNGKIDLVILDLKMPKMNGLEVCRELNKKYPNIKKIILSMIDQEQVMSQMLKEDINCYLLKTCPEEKLLHAIEQVVNQGFYFDEKSIQLMKKNLSQKGKANDESYYTDRELEVLDVLCQGASSAEIAEKLFISRRTVEVHKRNLMEKTNTKTSVELAMYAIKNGLIDLKTLMLN